MSHMRPTGPKAPSLPPPPPPPPSPPLVASPFPPPRPAHNLSRRLVSPAQHSVPSFILPRAPSHQNIGDTALTVGAQRLEWAHDAEVRKPAAHVGAGVSMHAPKSLWGGLCLLAALICRAGITPLTPTPTPLRLTPRCALRWKARSLYRPSQILPLPRRLPTTRHALQDMPYKAPYLNKLPSLALSDVLGFFALPPLLGDTSWPAWAPPTWAP
jgi:hypothetical protein